MYGLVKTTRDLYAMGAPRPPRIDGYNLKPKQNADLIVNSNGMVQSNTKGASTFANIDDFGKLNMQGNIHKLPAGTDLPAGFDVITDGKDYGGSQFGSHHTLAPCSEMPPEEFVNGINDLPWEFVTNTKVRK